MRGWGGGMGPCPSFTLSISPSPCFWLLPAPPSMCLLQQSVLLLLWPTYLPPRLLPRQSPFPSAVLFLPSFCCPSPSRLPYSLPVPTLVLVLVLLPLAPSVSVLLSLPADSCLHLSNSLSLHKYECWCLHSGLKWQADPRELYYRYIQSFTLAMAQSSCL